MKVVGWLRRKPQGKPQGKPPDTELLVDAYFFASELRCLAQKNNAFMERKEEEEEEQ